MQKKTIFLILSVFCLLITFVGAVYVIIFHKSAGYSVIPMLACITFSSFCRKAKSESDDL